MISKNYFTRVCDKILLIKIRKKYFCTGCHRSSVRECKLNFLGIYNYKDVYLYSYKGRTITVNVVDR